MFKLKKAVFFEHSAIAEHWQLYVYLRSKEYIVPQWDIAVWNLFSPQTFDGPKCIIQINST